METLQISLMWILSGVTVTITVVWIWGFAHTLKRQSEINTYEKQLFDLQDRYSKVVSFVETIQSEFNQLENETRK